jgi:hypothetical protein
MMARRKRKRDDEVLNRLLRSAGDDVVPSPEFHERTLGLLKQEYRSVYPESSKAFDSPRLVALLDRYIEKTRPRARFFKSPRPYRAVSAVAASILLALFVFVPVTTSTPPTSFELERARSLFTSATGPDGLRLADRPLRAAAIRSQLAGVLPEERLMNLEFLRFAVSRSRDIRVRADLLFMLDGVSPVAPRVAGLSRALEGCLAALRMPEAHAGMQDDSYVQLLLEGMYREAAEVLAPDNRVNARFLRAWALKEAGDYAQSRALFEQLAGELTEASVVRPLLPRAMIAYSHLWEGDLAQGAAGLASLARSEPALYFQVGYLRHRFLRDGDAAFSAWRRLPPGELRAYALVNLAPRGDIRPDVTLAYYTERDLPELGRCLVLAITGKDLDGWTRVRLNGAEMAKVHTGTDELLVPLTDKPAQRLHLEIRFPRQTLRRTLIPHTEER